MKIYCLVKIVDITVISFQLQMDSDYVYPRHTSETTKVRKKHVRDAKHKKKRDRDPIRGKEPTINRDRPFRHTVFAVPGSHNRPVKCRGVSNFHSPERPAIQSLPPLVMEKSRAIDVHKGKFFRLKLDLYEKTTLNKLKIRILSETSILYLIRHASFILIVGLHL